MNTSPEDDRRSGSVLPALGAAAFGLGWFWLNGGSTAIDPTSLSWCMKDDLGQHVLGWLFFRGEPWALPVGNLSSLLYPLSTTIGLTDSNPLVALLLKPFSALLPVDFQFIGLWLALCFALQGFFGARLAGLFSGHPVHQLLAGAVFTLAPPLLHRVNHDTLCAHWLVLALIWLGLAPAGDRRTATRRGLWAVALASLASIIHPYLGAMAIPLALAALARMRLADGSLGTARALGLAALSVGLPLGIFAAFGHFSSDVTRGAGGFGYFSANLLTFFNPMGWSRVLPTLAAGSAQYEGFAYLGLGALVALGAAALLVAARQVSLAGWRRWLPLVLACLGLAFFALSSRIMLGGREVLDLTAFYRPLLSLADPFRSSGRFIWPLYYLVLTAALAALLIRFGRSAVAGAVAVGLVLAVQLADVQPKATRELIESRPWSPLPAPAWQQLPGGYRHLALYPPHIIGGSCEGPRYSPDYYVPFAYWAYRAGMTLNSGNSARQRSERTIPYCRALKASVERGELDPDTVYVVHPSEARHFAAGGAVCSRLDGYLVCAPPRPGSGFAEALAASPVRLPAARRDLQ